MGWLPWAVAIMLALPCIAQNALRIDTITLVGNQVEIVVADDGTGATGYQIQGSSNLVGPWSPFGAVQNKAGTQTTLSTTRPVGDSFFFRVVGVVQSANPGDLDGDGLTKTFEENGNYSDPTKFDTDGDGFSDGQEFAYGTRPRNASDYPKLASLPAIEFASATESFVEGSATKYEITLNSSRFFSGPVAYRINTRSTVPASDYTLGGVAGTVNFSGTSGTIDVTFIDDFESKPTRILFLELTPVGFSAGYRVGGGSNHIVCLCENDCYWTGAINDGLLSRDVRLRIFRKTGQPSQVAFVAGNADGQNDIDAGASSQSTGIIPSAPVEVWPATAVQDTSMLFSATSPLLPVTVSTSRRFDGSRVKITEAALTRKLTISADAGVEAQLVDQKQSFVGRFTEEIRPVDPDKIYLNRTREGIAFFIKDLASPPEIEVVTIPTTAP